VEPPVDDFGLGNGGGSRDIAAASFYRLIAECASRPFYPQQNRGYAQARPQPGLIVVRTMAHAPRSAKWGRLIKPLTMIKRSLPTGFSLICQTDRMPAGGAAWGFFGGVP
jgi:hypothetical protein